MAAPDAVEVRRNVIEARRLLADRQFDQARGLWEELARVEACAAEAHHALFTIAEQTGKTDDGLAHLRLAARLEDRHPRFGLRLLRVLERQPGTEQERDDVLRDLMERFPDEAALWGLKARTLAAKGAVSEAASAADRAIGLNAEDAEAHVAAGLAALDLGSVQDAERHLHEALRLGSRNPKVAFTLGQIVMARLDEAGGAALEEERRQAGDAATADTLAAWRSAVAAERRFQGAYPKVVALCGSSMCGSTLMGKLLGSLDGARMIGESHRLTKSRTRGPHGATLEVLDLPDPEQQSLTRCTLCEGNDVVDRDPADDTGCAVFDRAFRLGLAHDPVGWYRRILERAGGDFLVTTDKSFTILQRLDPLQRYDALVLFKDPVAAFASEYKTRESKAITGRPVRSEREYLDVWSALYRRHVSLLRPTGKKIFLYWKAFQADPEGHLRLLCAALDIPFNPRVLEGHVVRHHEFGGNGGVNDAALSGRPMRVEKRAAPPLPDDILRNIQDHERSRIVFDDLMAGYRASFPGLGEQ